MITNTTTGYLDFKLLPFWVKPTAFELACTSWPFNPIAIVLRLVTWSKVFYAIVQTISIFMVRITFGKSKDNSDFLMHSHCESFPITHKSSCRIPDRISSPSFVFFCIPFPLIKIIKKNGINDGEFASTQRNPASTVSHSSKVSARVCFADGSGRSLFISNSRDFVKT